MKMLTYENIICKILLLSETYLVHKPNTKACVIFFINICSPHILHMSIPCNMLYMSQNTKAYVVFLAEHMQSLNICSHMISTHFTYVNSM